MSELERNKIHTPQLFIAVTVNILVASTLILSSFPNPISMKKYLWLGAIYLISLLRLFIHFKIHPSKLKNNLHYLTILLVSLIWATFPYAFFVTLSYHEKIFSLIIFAGMSAGGVNLLTTDIKSAITYASALIIPYAVILILSNNAEEQILGWLSIVFWGAVCLSTIQISKFINRYIKNKIQLDELVQHLEEKVNERSRKITELEQKDSLTGLLNRYSFIKNVELASSAGHTKSNRNIKGIVHIDIQGFKSMVNRYGHQCGDHILTVIAKRLKQLDSSHNSISCYWGGDEFTIYISMPSPVKLKIFGNHIKQLLSLPIEKNGIHITPTFFYGINILDPDTPLEEAMQRAYLALTYSKDHNQKVTFYNQKIHQKFNREEYLRKALETAIENDDFMIYLQPITDVTNNQIAGCESLARWKLNNQFIPPDEFIGIAEKHGSIIKLGNLILKKALIALQQINTINPSLTLSINVSAIQFESDVFINYLEHLLQIYDVNPKNIHLELTERTVSSNLNKLNDIIKRIKAKGIAISVDDFGTGFSSISILKNLSVDFIKIDKSYITPICSDTKSESIVDAVSRMSHSINCKVIAEGIEEKTQLDKIAEIRIDFYQGYYFSRPIPVDEFKSLLFTQRC